MTYAALLAEIYGWFTDTSAGGLRSAGGFDTRGLQDAKALLDERRPVSLLRSMIAF
jgi:hypothetical protein